MEHDGMKEKEARVDGRRVPRRSSEGRVKAASRKLCLR